MSSDNKDGLREEMNAYALEYKARWLAESEELMREMKERKTRQILAFTISLAVLWLALVITIAKILASQ